MARPHSNATAKKFFNQFKYYLKQVKTNKKAINFFFKVCKLNISSRRFGGSNREH